MLFSVYTDGFPTLLILGCIDLSYFVLTRYSDMHIFIYTYNTKKLVNCCGGCAGVSCAFRGGRVKSLLTPVRVLFVSGVLAEWPPDVGRPTSNTWQNQNVVESKQKSAVSHKLERGPDVQPAGWMWNLCWRFSVKPSCQVVCSHCCCFFCLLQACNAAGWYSCIIYENIVNHLSSCISLLHLTPCIQKDFLIINFDVSYSLNLSVLS